MDIIDQKDKISMNLAKMEALLISITGEGFEAFETMNREMQHNFLLTISDFAGETRKAWCKVGTS
jgi:hypothetical protein